MQGADGPEWPPPLGDEPPAVANLLTHDFELTRSAMAATLLDLVARDLLSLEQVEPGVYLLRVEGRDAQHLLPYERQVYEAVVAAADHGTVPVEVLTKELRLQPNTWMRRFRRAVVDDAQARGLVRSRWTSNALVWLPLEIAGVMAVIGALGLLLADNGLEHLRWAVVVAWAVATVGIFAPDWLAGRDRQRASRDGRRAARQWLVRREAFEADETLEDLPPTAVAVWDRHMAYAVALGVAHRAAAEIPLGDDDGRRAWSSATGRWRRVRITYPRLVPPAWGRPPVQALTMALVIGAVGTWLSFRWSARAARSPAHRSGRVQPR